MAFRCENGTYDIHTIITSECHPSLIGVMGVDEDDLFENLRESTGEAVV